MKRTRLLLFVTLLITFLALLSISSVTAQESTLVIWADGERAPLLVELGAQFTEEFGVAVEVVEKGLGAARDDLLNFGPAGEGPDILIAPHDHIGQHVANGAIVPIDLTGLEDMFLPTAINAFTYEGQVWGLPYAQENTALIRNVDLVPEAPATWQEVRTISEELQEQGIYGFLANDGDTYHEYPIISAFGGYIFGQNEDGTFNVDDIGLNSEGGLAAAEWLADMYADGLMVPNVDDDVLFQLFNEGQLAMFITGPWFTQSRLKEAAEAGINFSVDKIPGAEGITEVGSPFGGAQGFLISAFSENQLLAESFLFDFVATDEFMQALWDKGGRIPAWVNVDSSSDPLIAGFVAAGETTTFMPAIPEMGSVWASAGAALNLIATGADPVESMNTAVVQIQEAIAKAASGARSASLPGSHQSEAGCANDWDPTCEQTIMEPQGDGIFTLTLTLPAGDYEYKIAINEDWAENYGANGEPNGPNIALSLSAETEVTFTYDDNTHIVTDSVNDGS